MSVRVSRYERLGWAVLSVLLVVSSLTTLLRSQSQARNAVHGQRAAKDTVARLEQELAPVRQSCATAPSSPTLEASPSAAEEDQDEQLRRQLFTDLEHQSRLIPYPGVLGGKMGFSDSAGLHVL